MGTILKLLMQLASQIDWSNLGAIIKKSGKKLQPETVKENTESASVESKEPEYVEVIDFVSYITASNKYPTRLQSKELTDEVVSNAYKLLKQVNLLLNELKIYDVKVSSGFRPSNVNAGIANAAKKSNHLKCLAVDLVDKDGKLDALFMSRLDLLEKYGLYLESPKATPNWSHIQCVAPKSGNRVFMP